MNPESPGGRSGFWAEGGGLYSQGRISKGGEDSAHSTQRGKKPVSEILEGRRKEEEEGRYYFYYVQPRVCTTKALGARSALLKKTEFGRWK